jgi:putative transposase
LHPERQHYVSLIREVIISGATQKCACLTVDIIARTFERWTDGHSVKKDKRPDTKTVPSNKLSVIERQQIIELCNQPDYANLHPVRLGQDWLTTQITWH